MKIELTDQQQQQVKQGGCIEIIDPASESKFVLIGREQYEQVRHLLEPRPGGLPEDASAEIPPGILRSQRAFWRDLPGLLEKKRQNGKWVLYHGDDQVRIAKDRADLIRECIRRNIADDSYYIGFIYWRELAPWEVEEVEGGGHEVGEVEIFEYGDHGGEPT